jgi:hypothetical protein
MTVSHNATVKKLMNTTGFLFGGKKNIQNKTKTQTQTRKKKKKKKDNLDQLNNASKMLTN